MRKLFAFLLFVAAAVSATPTPELAMTVTGTLVIAPDGTVQEHTLDAGLAPVVEALVDRSVRAWRFEPILVDGRSVTAKTRMSLDLNAGENAQGGYSVTLSGAWFGVPGKVGERRAPRYPTDAIRAQIGARLLMVARLDAQGHVVAVHPYQTSLTHKINSESLARRWRSRFEAAGIKALMQWKFEPGESIGGEAVGGSITVPMSFAITTKPQDIGNNRWRAYVPGPISPAPWLETTRLAQIDTDALDDGDIGPLESRFKLTSDVLGKAL